ncbi:MAG: hypothetical protein K0R52_767 [Alphaproteobacteria bacterium]|jgi:hypothetical protein|nr:hypothetical protein [Alphaproteobacteria bacterium]
MHYETKQPTNRGKVESLYNKYITLAKEAQKREDYVLAEGYYQRAEHCLHIMNESSDFVSTPVSRSSTRMVRSVKKEIEDLCLGRSSPEQSLSKNANSSTEKSDAPDQPTVLPFKGHFLRRNRRKIHHT